MQRPRIGITGPDRGGLAAWVFTAAGVLRAGGWPVRIRPSAPYEGPLEGVIIGGGADVSPLLYADGPDEDAPLDEAGADIGERAAAVAVGLVRRALSLSFADRLTAPRTDEARDALETEWIRRAFAEEIPLVGICRGMQLANVVRGGDLIQDVRPLYTEHAYVRSVWPRKRVSVKPSSLLSHTIRKESCRVNALHRQAVGRLGDGFEAVAWEPSGVVQAIEHGEHRFALGLQWHPELLPQLPAQRRLFASLVREASRRRRDLLGWAPVPSRPHGQQS